MRSRTRVQTDTERLGLARQIRAAGVPIFIAEDDGKQSDSPDGISIHNIGTTIESHIFDFDHRAGVMLRISITFKITGVAVDAFDLELPWPARVSWLPDPLDYDGISTVYRFGGNNTLEFSRDDVLNHRANVGHIWACGQSMEGFLLGIVDAPIPDEFKIGETVPVFLTISDQFSRQYRVSLSLLADPSEKGRKLRRAKANGLLDYASPNASVERPPG